MLFSYPVSLYFLGMSIYLLYGLKHSKENKDISGKENHEYAQLKNEVDHSD